MSCTAPRIDTRNTSLAAHKIPPHFLRWNAGACLFWTEKKIAHFYTTFPKNSVSVYFIRHVCSIICARKILESVGNLLFVFNDIICIFERSDFGETDWLCRCKIASCLLLAEFALIIVRYAPKVLFDSQNADMFAARKRRGNSFMASKSKNRAARAKCNAT